MPLKNIVNKFYNLYDPEDDILQKDYIPNEHHVALGLNGTDTQISKPTNYIQHNVLDKIIAFDDDADGDYIADSAKTFVPSKGDNHCGYMGFRAPYSEMLLPNGDGAIGVVVQDWNAK
jgi:hypothetical protein